MSDEGIATASVPVDVLQRIIPRLLTGRRVRTDDIDVLQAAVDTAPPSTWIVLPEAD